jgi:hypothetical protein
MREDGDLELADRAGRGRVRWGGFPGFELLGYAREEVVRELTPNLLPI